MSTLFNFFIVSWVFAFMLYSTVNCEVIYLNDQVTEFDAWTKTDDLTLNCPMKDAVWIVPIYYEVDLKIPKIEKSFNSTNLILPINKTSWFFWGTYSCCSREDLPSNYRNKDIVRRSKKSCVHGCCPSFMKKCELDQSEKKCRQLRLIAHTGDRHLVASVTQIGESVMLPCMSFQDDVEIKADDLSAPHLSKTFIPGFGYCVSGVRYEGKDMKSLSCIYTNYSNLAMAIIPTTLGHSNTTAKPILKFDNSYYRPSFFTDEPRAPLPSTINVLKNSTFNISCENGNPYRIACLQWGNLNCDYSCSVHKIKDYPQGTELASMAIIAKKNKQIRCIAHSTNGADMKVASVSINVTEKPYLHVFLSRESEKVIIQHVTKPVISVKVSVSPQTISDLDFTATRVDTSSSFVGRCFNWKTVCNITLQRPATFARYQLKFKLRYGEKRKKVLTATRWVRLLTHYNNPPEIKGLPSVGLTDKNYTALCQQDAMPRGKVAWLFSNHNKITQTKNISAPSDWIESASLSDEINLQNTSQRYTCLLCRVTSNVSTTYSKSKCMTRSDVYMGKYDVILTIKSLNPLYNLSQSLHGSEMIADIVIGTELSILCATYHEPKTDNQIPKLKSSKAIRNIVRSWTGYSYQLRTTVIINDSFFNDTTLKCLTSDKKWNASPSIRLRIHQRVSPEIIGLPTHRRVLDSDELRQECIATGVPVPVVHWRHNGKLMSKPSRGRSQLLLLNMTRADSGVYTCVARGYMDVLQTLHIDVNPKVYNSTVMIIVMSVVFVILLVCILSIAYLFMKNRRLRRKLFDRYRLFLRNGDGENNYTNQFDLSQWQLPTQDLRLAREKLGQGEFGRVLKGLLRRSGSHGDEFQPVAVKQLLADNFIMGMGRSTEEESCSRRKFMEEIQIMSQVGLHENVLQMLGVVIDEDTLQISLVCEFCEGGNLVHYLQSQQTTFSMRPLSVSEDPCLTYEDLLRMAADIARGMSHIHSQGVLHRDLAARNVLIGASKTAKISDFGLSRNRSDYAGLEYARRNTSEKLPWKWLALECLRDGLFSAKSDVWSYGITLWEVFSLGNKPYPEQYYTNYFIRNLNSGYRLSRPPFASDSVFEVMKSCWLTEPDLRPSFSQITSTFQSLVERWRAEGERSNGSYIGKKQGLSNGGTHDRPTMHVQYVNVVGSLPSEHAEDCEMKLMEAYVPMSEGSAYTTYSHVF